MQVNPQQFTKNVVKLQHMQKIAIAKLINKDNLRTEMIIMSQFVKSKI